MVFFWLRCAESRQRAREGLLGIDDSVFILERPGKSIESFALLKRRQRSAELQFAPTKRAPEKSEELSPELGTSVAI
jgi:hypothetical protein